MANILVFDSGVGGLSIYQEIRQRLPHSDYFYCFDNAHFPYGELNESELIAAAQAAILPLVEQFPIDLVVIACNTASTILLPTLRARLSIPVVGVVPAIKPAVALTQNGIIGLLATPGTISRRYTHELIATFAARKRVLLKGSTELVRMAEEKLLGNPVNQTKLAAIMADWMVGDDVPDTIVLGCTHFPLLRQELASLMPQITWVDSGAAVAQRVVALLKQCNDEGSTTARAFCSRLDADAKALLPALTRLGIDSLMPIPLADFTPE